MLRSRIQPRLDVDKRRLIDALVEHEIAALTSNEARRRLVQSGGSPVGRRKITIQNSFPRLSDTAGSIPTPAPSSVGQDDSGMFGELLELGEVELAALRAAGTI